MKSKALSQTLQVVHLFRSTLQYRTEACKMATFVEWEQRVLERMRTDNGEPRTQWNDGQYFTRYTTH